MSSRLIGIEKLEVKNILLNQYEIKIITNKNLISLNGFNPDLSKSKFFINETEQEVIVKTKNIHVFFDKRTLTRTIFLNTNSYKEVLDSDLQNFYFSKELQTEIDLNLLVLEELTDKKSQRISSEIDLLSKKRGRWYSVQTGCSKATLEHNLTRESESFLANNPHCSKIGEIDITCFGRGSHVCIGSQYYDCGGDCCGLGYLWF